MLLAEDNTKLSGALFEKFMYGLWSILFDEDTFEICFFEKLQ